MSNTGKKSDPGSTIPPRDWSEYYTKLNKSTVDEDTEAKMRNRIQELEKNRAFSELDYRIDKAEIKKAVNKLKNGKAVGLDNISNEMIKYSINYSLPLIHKIMNDIYSNSYYPNMWAEVFILNIHKSGSQTDPFNYRGISIGSALGKLLSIILNNRLIHFIMKKKLLSMTQIGFLKDSCTADHVYTLKTIIDKFIKSNKKPLYVCFVDFKKAFDTIWHSGLLYKLLKNEISGHLYRIIKDMYSKVRCRVKTTEGLTEAVKSDIGVRQGDVLSPLLFNLYINDQLNSPLCDLISLNNVIIKCMMYADDIVLLSKSEKGLQEQLDILGKYCDVWQLNVNISKTKVMVVAKNKTSAQLTYKDKTIEQVETFPYLGVLFNSCGNFKDNLLRLSNKANRALYKLGNYNSQISLRVSNQMHIFDHTIKPILLYCAEVTFDFNPCSKKGFEDLKCESIMEKVHKKFLRYMLGLNSKTPIDGLYGDTGRYPFYIETIRRMINYEEKLEKAGPDTLLYHAHVENKRLSDAGIHTWSHKLKHIKNSLKCKNTTTKCAQFTSRTLKTRYEQEWHKRIHNDTRSKANERNKLRTFRKFKNIYKQETYLDYIKDYRTRSNFCRFRVSAHNLLIETGRHARIDLNKRICKRCSLNEIQDEKHALMICPAYQSTRDIIISDIEATYKNFANLDLEARFVWLLSNEDIHIIAKLSKLINTILTT